MQITNHFLDSLKFFLSGEDYERGNNRKKISFTCFASCGSESLLIGEIPSYISLLKKCRLAIFGTYTASSLSQEDEKI